eukprot:7683935-Pyramimonas_sp.AAC.1
MTMSAALFAKEPCCSSGARRMVRRRLSLATRRGPRRQPPPMKHRHAVLAAVGHVAAGPLG